MTEEEAKTKVCCADLANGSVGWNYCLGHKCMAWRWRDGVETEVFQKLLDEFREKKNKAEKNIYPVAKDFEKTEGHCGLAGAEH